MVSDNSNINSSEYICNHHPLGQDEILERIADIQRIRLSLNQFETSLRSAHSAPSNNSFFASKESTDRQIPVHEVESESESDTELPRKSQLGYSL